MIPYSADGRKRAFRVKEMHFDNDEAAVAWIIRNQFARRNLTAMQRAELALRLKEAVAAQAKKRQGARNDLKKNIPQKSAGSSKETRGELAKMAGVSHDTIAKVEKIVAEAEPAGGRGGAPEIRESVLPCAFFGVGVPRRFFSEAGKPSRLARDTKGVPTARGWGVW